MCHGRTSARSYCCTRRDQPKGAGNRPLRVGALGRTGVAVNRARIAAALLGLAVGSANGEPSRAAVSDYTTMIETICRQYAAAVARSGIPANLLFNQCMTQRHCQVSPGSPRYQCEMPGPMIIRPGA
jgi:hypothetical protein